MNDRRVSWWTGAAAVFEFELRQTLTAPRIAWWCVLTFFPVTIILLVLIMPDARTNVPPAVWQVFLFVLIPFLVSMLGTFKWTASAISSELEAQSWIYLAVRPDGRIAVLLGKYLAAITWVLPATLISATLSVLLMWVAGSSLTDNGSVWRTWFTIARLCCLAVPAYAAIYLALGTVFTRRSMVIAVAYSLFFELLVSFVPALINKLTIQYRLRALFVKWIGIEVSNAGRQFSWMDIVGDEPAWVHVTWLVGYTTVLIVLSTWLVQKREYLVTSSADVS